MGRCYIIFGRMPALLPTSLTQRALPKSVQILWNKPFGIWHCWQQSGVRRNFHEQCVIHYKALITVDTGQTCWNVRLCYTLEICTLSFGLSLPRTFDPKTKTWVKSQTRPMTYPPIFHTHTSPQFIFHMAIHMTHLMHIHCIFWMHLSVLQIL